MAAAKGRIARITVKQGADGDWYWAHKRRNGRKVGIGGEGFKTAGGAVRSFTTHQRGITGARIVFDIKTKATKPRKGRR